MRWPSCVFQRNLYKEIMEAFALSEQPKRRQIDNNHGNQLLSRRRVPDAFTFVPLGPNSAVFTRCASNGRPYEACLYHHGLQRVLYRENDTRCTVDTALTRDQQFVAINSNTRTSSEVHIVRAAELLNSDPWPMCVRVREKRVEYYLDHAHQRWYILTNQGPGTELRLLTAESEFPESWKPLYNPPQGTVLLDMELYEKAVLLFATEDTVPVLIVLYPEENDSQLILRAPEFTQFEREESADYRSSYWPVSLSSPGTPPTPHTLTPHTTHTLTSPGSDYCLERFTARSSDGTEIPLTLCFRKGTLKRDRQNPVLVHVYGCYGECLPIGWRAEGIPLLEQGWVLAYAHTRGGGEKGRHWYYSGMAEHKHNTFEDLKACVCEIQRCLTQPQLTALYGRSAGGLSVGAFINRWPELVQAAVLEVPLVNLWHSLSDSKSYLVSMDEEEFGQTIGQVASICPYHTLQPNKDYPQVLVCGALRDEVVTFTSVQQYIKRLRECGGRVQLILDRTNGHYGSEEPRERAALAARQLAFLCNALTATR